MRGAFARCVLRTWLARWTGSAWLTRRTRRASGSRRLRINVLNAAILLIGRCNRSRFARKHRLILWHAGLTRWSRLTRLALTCGPGLSALTWRSLLPLRFSKRRIHVTVHVPRFVIIVTAIAAAIAIVHVIHFSEPLVEQKGSVRVSQS